MNKVNCFVGILLALVFCSSCSAKSPEITGNPDPPNITSEERSLHQILQIDEDTSANGWFGKGCSSGSIADTDVTISGYPAETASKIGHQYTHSGTVSSSTEYRANYSIDTEGGNSGSPVYDENGIVWAIHTHGGNSGARITSWLYDILQNKYLEGVEKWG